MTTAVPTENAARNGVAVQLLDLHRQYGALHALDGLTLELAPGELVALLGPSGCGKTTALRMLAGLEEISEGVVRIGERVVNYVPSRDRDIAMVFQSYALYPHLTVYDNIAFGLRVKKVPKSEIDKRVHDAARILELEPFLKRKPRALSGGQRQRVAIARALLKDPRILILDDATSSVDATTESRITRALQELTHGRTTFIIAHRLSTIALADEIVVLEEGRVVAHGTHNELLESSDLYREIAEKGLPDQVFLTRKPVEAASEAGL
jgi:ABC-type sugar transport system ATPase subunit